MGMVVENVKTKKKICGEQGFILILLKITQVSEEVPENSPNIKFEMYRYEPEILKGRGEKQELCNTEKQPMRR